MILTVEQLYINLCALVGQIKDLITFHSLNSESFLILRKIK